MPTRGASLLTIAAIAVAGCTNVPSSAPSAAAGSPPVGPASAATSLAPSPAGTPIPTELVTIEGWRPVPRQPVLEGAHLQEVVWTGARFVAAGVDAEGHGIMVDSVDGQMWRTGLAATGDASVSTLAAGPGGVVAVGTLGGRPTSWTSPDGIAWTPSIDAFPASLGDDDILKVTGVVATDDGWLAVGRVEPGTGVQIDVRALRALVWTSADGRSWTPVSAQPSLEPGGMYAVTRVDGGFVGVGNRGPNAAIWRSSDGQRWEAGPDFGILPSSDASPGTTVFAYGVAATGGTTVVVGTALGAGEGGAPAARAWWSVPAAAWSEAFIDRPDVAVLEAAAVAGSRFLATGQTWPGMSACTGGIWSSADGAAWRCEGADQALMGFRARGVATSSTVELVVGATDGAWAVAGQSGAAWWRPARA